MGVVGHYTTFVECGDEEGNAEKPAGGSNYHQRNWNWSEVDVNVDAELDFARG